MLHINAFNHLSNVGSVHDPKMTTVLHVTASTFKDNISREQRDFYCKIGALHDCRRFPDRVVEIQLHVPRWCRYLRDGRNGPNLMIIPYARERRDENFDAGEPPILDASLFHNDAVWKIWVGSSRNVVEAKPSSRICTNAMNCVKNGSEMRKPAMKPA